ncbi:hypothetical protein FSARC_2814 [Fusarium sarcochroum]|uniref:NAD(P)-binding domain-containing protein n=1 Tax=Fusarium sarcochroum TaxID=1208366 RepID=A0A8H4XCG6_9HYPO|nr:hypothetical protein FSARC_2814 [Fusarium sarcochroum]
MKLVVGGATGFLGTEVIRQALQSPEITEVVALARRETRIPMDLEEDEAIQSKFKTVVCHDFSNYPQDVKDEVSGADACLWLIGVTPGKLKQHTWEQTRTICSEYALNAADTFAKLPRDGKSEALRFIYVSGCNAERDPSKKPWILGDYCVMRGQVEKQVLERAQLSDGRMQVLITKQGSVNDPGMGVVKHAFKMLTHTIVNVPTIGRPEMTAALLDQAVNGFEKDTLMNAELVAIGKKAMENASAEK